MQTDIYRQLQKQLDQYSMGFPATESGIEKIDEIFGLAPGPGAGKKLA